MKSLRKAIIENAYQVNISTKQITIWVKGVEARNNIFAAVPDIPPRIKTMRGGIFVLTYKLDDAMRKLLGE